MKNAAFWVLAFLSFMMLVPAVFHQFIADPLQDILAAGVVSITLAILAVGVAILGREE